MPGSPAGLARIDQLFGLDLYTSNFVASPIVFGAFPSLHAGWATLEAMFLSHVFPKLRPFFIAYIMWIWWATMYLSHHYAVDLVGGSLREWFRPSTLQVFSWLTNSFTVAGVVFYIAKANFLPRVQMDKDFRWDYDYVEIGDAPVGAYSYGLANLDTDFHHGGPSESDEWTAGSSSSVSSGSLSPIDENSSLWEGETLGSHSDSDTIEVVVDGPRR